MRGYTTLCLVLISLLLGACGNEAGETSPNETSSNEMVQKAAGGDKAAMRELEKLVAEKAKSQKIKAQKIKAQKTSLDELGGMRKRDKQFYWDLAAGKIDDDALRKLTFAGNVHAQVYRARTAGRRETLVGADRKLFTQWLERISAGESAHMYYALNGGIYPLAGEAAFMISEDYLNAGWLYPVDQTKAVAWLKKAANSGQPEAMYKLATRYQYALDMDKDMAAAKSWLEKSAAAGNRDAKAALKNREE